MRIPPHLASAFAVVLVSCSGTVHAPPAETTAIASPRPLRLASWNMEFLAERYGEGCQPRVAADYVAMRRIADGLDADVIVFQEVESIAAARRVFDPARYDVVIEERPGAPSGTCGGARPTQTVIRQAVGLAIRKGLPFDRNPDVMSLTLGNPQLRSGVDVTLRAPGHAPIRLLGVHLKSGCFACERADACATLMRQIPALEAWIDDAARGPVRFAVLGDWNRRLGLAGDVVWREIDDGDPANADLALADAGVSPRCDPRYDTFIDHIVMDRRAGVAMRSFAETVYPAGGKHYSDHCPVSVTID